MNHAQKLEEIYKKALTSNSSLTYKKIQKDVLFICNNIERAKGVYTVLLTLLVHKILYPQDDIRKHQAKMDGGKSYRTFDTKFITPKLKELKLASMAESGWLTRSMEKNLPYDMDYDADIKPKGMKSAFLNVIDYFQDQDPNSAENIATEILIAAIKLRESNTFEVKKIENPDDTTIDSIIDLLNTYIHKEFHIAGASKIPVILIYTICQQIIKEVRRYQNCTLKNLASHTAPDRNSKSCGDIEIFKGDSLFESYEIKLGKPVDNLMIDVAIEKITQFSPYRYYILSTRGIKKEDLPAIQVKIDKLKKDHGCELIIEKLFNLVKFDLTILSSLENFLQSFSKNIFEDKELKTIHKKEWEEMLKIIL
jgi:DNA (cytosine-5)-methyltransferase 1